MCHNGRKKQRGAVRCMLRMAAVLLPALVLLFLYLETNTLMVTRERYWKEGLPPGVDGLRMVQLSDLHNKRFGKGQKRLVKALREAEPEPELIVLTGDFIDETTRRMEPVRELLEQAVKIAPVYFIGGNHDAWSPCAAELEALFLELGIRDLSGRYTILRRGGDSILLAGLPFWNQPELLQPLEEDRLQGAPPVALRGCAPDILLAHDPTPFAYYQELGAGLVLCGHMHGGQLALPGGKALLGPGSVRRFFPDYARGRFEENGVTMLVNRGLGASVLPFRLFARPEVTVVEFRAEP